MKLNSPKLAAAATGAAALCYIGCSLFTYFFPVYSLQLTANLFHISTLQWVEQQIMITPANVLSGLLQVCVYSYIYAFLLALLYNFFNKKS